MTDIGVPITSARQAITEFAIAIDGPPNGALRWALDHWEDASPLFLTMLEEYASGTDESETTADALFFIIHLFGDKGDQRAYPALCRLMLNEERLIGTLGDTAAVETLKGILIKCFNGDPKPLQTVIESTQADSITRGEALFALAWVARDGRWPEPEFREYVSFLFREMLPKQQDYVWYNLVVVAAILGYEEFNAASEKLIADGLVPEEWMTLEEFPDLLLAGDPVGVEGLLSEEVAPFEDVMESLSEWPWDLDSQEDEEPEPMPVINPLRHIGRNDPCPCGSGKKFKKCCLVAE
jgi:uncharacterized protein